ncbi:hypothetical protein BDZ90DRAFT_25650 [Jaminaea rosea]|uniref:Uncharacterized protein n=1 Tax=Jaminaea rosea TaxID=1569628 RepID=A0A316UZV6_9BASI|nr:hypothetical protein BDZ90DRAFT_25650 [Jaminaea rosea]PWN30837.1 hypothetical protein BDZ90DRAFT_25650 [Jaminaea rosea]
MLLPLFSFLAARCSNERTSSTAACASRDSSVESARMGPLFFIARKSLFRCCRAFVDSLFRASVTGLLRHTAVPSALLPSYRHRSPQIHDSRAQPSSKLYSSLT